MNNIELLDGAMGSELIRKGLNLPNHTWSANANIEAEEIVSDCLKILISAPIKEKIRALRINIKEKELRGEDPSIDIFSLEKYRKKLNEF